jgi:hypothetical protein
LEVIAMMRTAIWLALAVLAGAYFIYAAATLDRRGDGDQIRSLVSDTATAIGKCDLDGTIRCVSADYKDDDGLTHDKLRMLLAQAFRSDSSFTTRATVEGLTIRGSAASALVHAVVRSSAGAVIYDRNLTLSLRKQRGRHAWVWPVDVWRVTSVRGLRIDFGWGGY